MRSIMALAAAAGLAAGMAISAPALAQCPRHPGAGPTGANTHGGCARRRPHNNPNRGDQNGYTLTYNNGYNNGWNPSGYNNFGYYPLGGGAYPSGGFDYNSPGGTFLGIPGYHGDF